MHFDIQDIVRYRQVSRNWQRRLTDTRVLAQVISRNKPPRSGSSRSNLQRNNSLQAPTDEKRLNVVKFVDELLFTIYHFHKGLVQQQWVHYNDLFMTACIKCWDLSCKYSYTSGKLAAISCEGQCVVVSSFQLDIRRKTEVIYAVNDDNDHLDYVRCSTRLLVAVSSSGLVYIWDHVQDLHLATLVLEYSDVTAIDVSEASVAVVAIDHGAVNTIVTVWTADSSQGESSLKVEKSFRVDRPCVMSVNDGFHGLDNEGILIENNGISVVYFYRYRSRVQATRYTLTGQVLDDHRLSDLSMHPVIAFIADNMIQRQIGGHYLIWSFMKSVDRICFMFFDPEKFKLWFTEHANTGATCLPKSVLLRGDTAYLTICRNYSDEEYDPDRPVMSELMAARIGEVSLAPMLLGHNFQEENTLVLGDEHMVIYIQAGAYMVCGFQRRRPYKPNPKAGEEISQT